MDIDFRAMANAGWSRLGFGPRPSVGLFDEYPRPRNPAKRAKRPTFCPVCHCRRVVFAVLRRRWTQARPPNYGVSYSLFDVAPPRRDPCQGAASASCRGRLEATAAVLMGAASIRVIRRLLRVCSAPPVGHLQDSLASPSTSGMMRRPGGPKFHGPRSRPLG